MSQVLINQYLPVVLEALRAMIEAEHVGNAAFARANEGFLKHAQEAINPGLTAGDVREMLIQHILTEEIFSKVFDSEFHPDNNVAKELYKLEATARRRICSAASAKRTWRASSGRTAKRSAL